MSIPRTVHARGGQSITLALDTNNILQRSLEVLPGLLIWSTLIGLTLLAFVAPTSVALALIAYDLYWVIRAVYVGTHLIASYRTLRRRQGIDWRARLDGIEDPDRATQLTHARIHLLEQQRVQVRDRRTKKDLRRAISQEREFLSDLHRRPFLPFRWQEILHVVILPTYREPLALLTQSLDALAASRYPLQQLWVVVALEERAGEEHVQRVQRALHERYAQTFGSFLMTLHPDGIPGERRVKSANATWAARQVQQRLEALGIPFDRVVISNFDADTVVSPNYFGALSYAYLTTPDRLRCSYQPLPLYHNNIWDAPAFTRVIATNSTFWLLIESTRPERLITYSSHSMPFQALVDVGFWDPTVVSEDSHIFWQCYLHYNGRYRTIPLYTTISMDATQAPTFWQTVVHQYKQKRRWAWGIENFPYIARAFLEKPQIPRWTRIRYCLVMLEAWHSWATAALILAGLGWLTVFFGGTEFQQTILAFNLPRVSRNLLTIATAGLFLNMSLSLFLLPPPPPGTPKRKYLWMALQWVLVPLISWTLGTLPVLDAVTRLMVGKYLGFWVTPKARAPVAPIPTQPFAVGARQ